MVSHCEDAIPAHKKPDALENKVVVLSQPCAPAEEDRDVIHTLLHQLLWQGCFQGQLRIVQGDDFEII